MSSPTYNLQYLLASIGDGIRDTTNASGTNLKKVRALNRVLDELSGLAEWSFAKKQTEVNLIEDSPINGHGVSNILGISDFKSPDDLRKISNHTVELEYLEPDIFAVKAGQGRSNAFAYTIEKLGNDYCLRTLFGGENKKTEIDSMDTYNPSSGTWTASGGVSSVATDADFYKAGSGSVKFNISTSGTAGLSKTFSTTLDFTKMVGKSEFRFWLYLSSSDLTNVGLRWGDSDSAYWSATATTRADGSPFQAGWNRIGIPWQPDTTKTGSPDKTVIDYFQSTFANSTTAQTDARIDDFSITEAEEFTFSYFTDKFVKTSSSDSSWQARFSTDSINTAELLVAPDSFINALIEGANYQMLSILKSRDNSESQIRKRDYDLAKKILIERWGQTPKRPQKKLKLRSYWAAY